MWRGRKTGVGKEEIRKKNREKIDQEKERREYTFHKAVRRKRKDTS